MYKLRVFVQRVHNLFTQILESSMPSTIILPQEHGFVMKVAHRRVEMVTFFTMNVVLHVCCNNVLLYSCPCNFIIIYVGLVLILLIRMYLYDYFY